MRPMLVIMRPLIIYFNFIWGPPDFTTCHYFSFGGPSLNFFMRHPWFFHEAYVTHYESPSFIWEETYFANKPLWLYLFWGPLSFFLCTSVYPIFPFLHFFLLHFFSFSFFFFFFFSLFFLPFRARPPSPQGGSTCSQCSPPGYGPGIGVYSIVLVSRVGPMGRVMDIVSTNIIRLTRFVLTFALKRYSINLEG